MRARDSLVRHVEGFGFGRTVLTRIGEAEADTGIEFSIVRMRPGERWATSGALESACLLTGGRVRFHVEDRVFEAARMSLFDEEPSVAHHAPGDRVEVEAVEESELAVVEVENPAVFEPQVWLPGGLLEVEQRDRGLWDDTAWREVRTVIDLRNRPTSRLVLGEVVTLPGRWSSYPPHHHPQPEIYHYRFAHPAGYGHAELGDEVLKVRHGDTVKILDRVDHPQVAAPGYAMWYLWVIRHLPGAPYTVPEFTRDHLWLKEPGARAWAPRHRKEQP